MVPQYPQSIYVGDMSESRSQSEIIYNNYLSRAPQQNRPQEWESPEKAPQFIYAPHSDTGPKAAEGKSERKSKLQDKTGSVEGTHNINTKCVHDKN